VSTLLINTSELLLNNKQLTFDIINVKIFLGKSNINE